MTQVPATTQPGGQVEQWQDTGLEDMSATDAVIPRIKIVGKEGMWEDNLTHTKIPHLYFIALGLVKQRVLFHPNVGDNDVPMCKSSDFVTGYPNPDAPREKSFPWAQSGFDPNTIPPLDAEGKQRALPCANCQLKDWGSHPTNSTPYCAEQWTLPIYFDASGQPAIFDPNVAWDPNLAEWTPAIITLQKSSLKPIRSYLSSFKAGNKPPFLSVCKGTLKMQQRGDVIYSIPSFNKGPESPRDKWNEFAKSYGEMKVYLQRPPLRDEDDPDTDTASDNNWDGGAQQAPPPAQPVAQQPPAQQAPPPQQPQVVQGEVVQQDPWGTQPAAAAPGDPWAPAAEATQPPAQPTPQQPPAQQQPAAQAPPPQPSQPQAPPAQQAPPPAQPVAPAQPEQQPVTQEPPAQSPPPAGQGLPF